MKVLSIIEEQLVSIGVENILQEQFTAIEIVSSIDYNEILEQTELNSFDVILLDVEVSDLDALYLMKILNNKQPQAKTLVISRIPPRYDAMKYLDMGVSGFLDKSTSGEDLVIAIKLIQKDKLYISKDMLMSIYNNNGGMEHDATPFHKLSKRELEIFELMIKGKRIKDISKIMNIQQSTTSTLKKRVMSKLKVDNMMNLKMLALEYGY